MRAFLFVLPVLAVFAFAGCSGEPPASAAVPSNSETVKAAVAATTHRDLPQAAIAVGAKAPDFELPGSDGQTHKLSDFSGQHVVLAFFPKAFTGG